MSSNHDAYLLVNLISDGAKISQCSELFMQLIYIQVRKAFQAALLLSCTMGHVGTKCQAEIK